MGGVFEVLVRGLMLGLLGRSFVSTYPDFVPSLLMQGPSVETVLLVLGVAGGIMVYCCVRLWAVGLRFMVVVVGTMIVVSFGWMLCSNFFGPDMLNIIDSFRIYWYGVGFGFMIMGFVRMIKRGMK